MEGLLDSVGMLLLSTKATVVQVRLLFYKVMGALILEVHWIRKGILTWREVFGLTAYFLIRAHHAHHIAGRFQSSIYIDNYAEFTMAINDVTNGHARWRISCRCSSLVERHVKLSSLFMGGS
jgi:hypothetical protein